MNDTYKIFAAHADNCWRQHLGAGEHGTLESAIKEARSLVGRGVLPTVPLVVSTHSDGQELFRADPPDLEANPPSLGNDS